MYRNNPTLTKIEIEVGEEFEAAFGFSLPVELIHLIYGSQSTGVLHYMSKLETVKMRGLLVFKPSAKKLAQAGIELPTPTKPEKKKKKKQLDTNHNLDPLVAKFNFVKR